VQWDGVKVWNGGPNPLTFEAILFGDGTVILQYQSMPDGSTGSWTKESIGFEDQTGSHGVQMLYGEVPSPQTAYQIPASCHVNHDNGACKPTRYTFNPQKLPMQTAEDVCVRQGGHLASVHNEADQNAIEILVAADADRAAWDADAAWIGLHDMDTEGGCNGDAFVWTDGTHNDFSAWSPGEPNDWATDQDDTGAVIGGHDNCLTGGFGDENCATAPPSRDYKWADQICEFQMASVCGFCGGGACKPTHYTYTAEGRTQMAAEDECIARGGHLASAHGPHDQAVWEQLVPAGARVWIGMHDRESEAGCDGQTFRWTDGTDTDFMNWSAGEPNDWLCGTDGTAEGVGDQCISMCDSSGRGQEDCVSIMGGTYEEGTGRDWQWNDDLCSRVEPYVCGASIY
jgi:hypothetical protein